MSDSIQNARKLIREELDRLYADRIALNDQIAKVEAFLAGSEGLLPPAPPEKNAALSLDGIPREGYGAITQALKVLLAKGGTTKQLTADLHRAGFLKDPVQPTPVRTAIKGLRKRGVVVNYDEATGVYRLS